MNTAMVAAILVATAVWVVTPDPRRQIRRLDAHPSRNPGRVVALLQGRQGTPPLRRRLLWGLAGASLVWVLLPASATGMVMGAVVGALLVIGGGYVPRGRRTTTTTAVELADAVELLAVCLEAGAPMRHALDVVGEVSGGHVATVLGKVSGPLALGVTEEQSWRELVDDGMWGPVARDIARSARSGTSLVEVLRVHAFEARLQAKERALKIARTAGVRSVVPLMACFLPAFVLVGVVPIIAGLLTGLLSA